MTHQVRNASDINRNMYKDGEHSPITDYVVAKNRPAFGQSFDYVDPSVPKDGRYNLFKATPNWDYQADAFAIGQLPSKFANRLRIAHKSTQNHAHIYLLFSF